MNLFYVLAVLLVLTRVFGEVAERLRQPALVGELVAGIALGASVAAYPETFPGLNDLQSNHVFVTITDLGMFFLMLFAGMEMQPNKILKHAAGSAAVALGGMILPLVLGVGLGWLLLPESPRRTAQCLFLGTALAITAVPATVRILSDLRQLNTRVGQTIVSAAVFDDILSLVLLAWLTGVLGAESAPGFVDFMWLSGKVLLFFAITGVVGSYLFPLGGRSMHRLKVHELEMSAVLVAAFAFAVLAEVLGLHFIVGAFVAGLYFGKRTISPVSYTRVQQTLSGMTFGFLAPIFFASIGLQLDFSPIVDAPGFLLVLILLAFTGKVLGAGAGARMVGFSHKESFAIGVGMSPRGAVELVIAGIALNAGLFVGGTGIVLHLFSAVVFMSVVTTVLSPVILARVFRGSGHESPDQVHT